MSVPITILLADDDLDDCLFFKNVLEELPVTSNLITVNSGMELMRYLTEETPLPDALFLDLNMPRKNGFECLTEIKTTKKLNPLPVVIYSTSYDSEVVNLLYEKVHIITFVNPATFQNLNRLFTGH